MTEEQLNDLIPKIQAKFPSLKVQKEGTWNWIEISGFPGNPDLEVVAGSAERAEVFLGIEFDDIQAVPGLRSIRTKGHIYVGLNSPTLRRLTYSSESPAVLLTFKMHYGQDELLIQFIREGIGSFLASICLDITGYTYSSDEKLSTDIQNITDSLAFDMDYNFGHLIELAKTSRVPVGARKKRVTGFPDTTIQTTYKPLVPELLQYYVTGDRAAYPPFAFLSYYHILEYFLDKSAYQVATQKIKSLMLRPDFHLKPDYYTTEAIKVLKQETEKNMNDKIKIQRTLRQFVDEAEFFEFLGESGLQKHFSAELKFDDMKLILPAVDTSSDSKFYDTLTRRIYALRCSIVHSNPDYDETKAVPFVHSAKNVNSLRTETLLLHYIAKLIILKSSDAKAR